MKSIKIAVGALIFNKDKILLCRSPKWSKKWLIPGGGMRWGESVEDTIKREIKEETGLKIKFKKVGAVKTVTSPPEFKKNSQMHFLMIDCECQTNSAKVTLNEEHDRSKWVTPKVALKMDLLSYSRKPIEDYLKRQKQEDYLAGWQRCKADFKNYQKKVETLLEDARKKASQETFLEVLPVLDNFNLAVSHIPPKEQASNWVTGILYIKKQLEDILSKTGITEMKALGQKFDPLFHECLEEVRSSKKDRGRVIEVMQKGYQKDGEVLRAAKVKIGK